MIQFSHVSTEYEKNHIVLNDLTFSIREGEKVGLIGANGAGKSTLMKVMLGLLSYRGSVQVDGMEVTREHLKEIRKKLGMVFQNSDNQMFMPTVFEDMMFGLLNYGESREVAEAKVDRTLQSLGLEHLKMRYNHKLSGGEKRMAAIATVIAMEPRMLLLDEPTSVLDPYNRRLVLQLIQSTEQTKLIASHDLRLIEESCDRVILLSEGQLVADGPVQEILKNRELLARYRLE